MKYEYIERCGDYINFKHLKIMEQEIFNRLLIEFNDLNEKIIKCREFLLDEEKVKTLDHLNRDLLIAQLKAQETYLSLLSIRIGLNTPKESVVNSESEESSND